MEIIEVMLKKEECTVSIDTLLPPGGLYPRQFLFSTKGSIVSAEGVGAGVCIIQRTLMFMETFSSDM